MNSRRILAAAVALISGASWGLEPPWGKGETLGEQVLLEKTAVCTDGKGHYVAAVPKEERGTHLFYGDGKTFVQVATGPWTLGDMYFLEPRFLNKTANSNFRGNDMRMYSE